MLAVTLEPILGEEDLEQLLVGLLVGSLHPLFQFVRVKVVLLCLERRLQGDIEDPVLLVAAFANEIDSLTCL